MPDYREFLDMNALRRAERAATPAMAAHRQAQATIVMRLEQLLAADEWGVYRAHIQALAERDQAAVEMLRVQIDAGTVVGDDLARLSLRLQRLLGRLEARAEDLAVPQAVIEQGQEVMPSRP